MKKYNLMWSCGFDSTVCLCKLSQQPVYIQPYCFDYLERKEDVPVRDRQNKVCEILNAHDLTKAKILPVKYLSYDDIPECQNIRKAVQKLRSRNPDIRLGDQYMKMSELAEMIHEDIVVGIVPPVKKKAKHHLFSDMDMIKAEGATLMKKGFGRIDERRSTKELITIYGRYLMPLLRTTEHQNYDWLIKNGYDDVIKNIRFCRQPLPTGEPCGVCESCIHKILAGLNDIIPVITKKNFNIYELLQGKTDDAGFALDVIFMDFLHNEPFKQVSDKIPLVMNISNENLFQKNIIIKQNALLERQKIAVLRDIQLLKRIQEEIL